MPRFLCSLIAVATCFAVALARTAASEETILVVKQDYKIIEFKDGGQSRDTRQTIYISPDFICIDEDGGGDGDTITESIALDLKNRVIYNFNHAEKRKVTESFDDRRKRIEERKKIRQQDIDNHDPGPTRDRLIKMYRALLDDKRSFTFAANAGEAKELNGVKFNPVKIMVPEMKDYVPLSAQLHPEIPLPYDNAEVLYLLQIIGKRMSDFLREHKEKFKYVPMELHLDLAAGGSLDTKVISVEKIERSKLPSRGKLGDAFAIPPYEEEPKRRISTTPPKRDDKERAD
jgi:hypothetical protein